MFQATSAFVYHIFKEFTSLRTTIVKNVKNRSVNCIAYQPQNHHGKSMKNKCVNCKRRLRSYRFDSPVKHFPSSFSLELNVFGLMGDPLVDLWMSEWIYLRPFSWKNRKQRKTNEKEHRR